MMLKNLLTLSTICCAMLVNSISHAHTLHVAKLAFEVTDGEEEDGESLNDQPSGPEHEEILRTTDSGDSEQQPDIEPEDFRYAEAGISWQPAADFPPIPSVDEADGGDADPVSQQLVQDHTAQVHARSETDESWRPPFPHSNDNKLDDESDQQHHNSPPSHHHHHHAHGTFPMALSPGSGGSAKASAAAPTKPQRVPEGNVKAAKNANVKDDRVDKNYFEVPEMAGKEAINAHVWNNYVQPMVPVLALAASGQAPIKYTLPVILASLFPQLMGHIAGNEPDANPETVPQLTEEITGLDPTDPSRRPNEMPEDKYSPPPPPPPIPPPLPGSYEYTGVPFRGHLIVPRQAYIPPPKPAESGEE